jgi:hypothetical protein
MFWDTFFSDVLYADILSWGWDLTSSSNSALSSQTSSSNLVKSDYSNQIPESNTVELELIKIVAFVKQEKPQLIDSTL